MGGDGFGEFPIHEVGLSSYYLAETEVTVGQYNIFCKAKGQSLKSGEETHPVTNVSWNDAVVYCLWLSEVSGEKYRLPTEAEWEFAARGGNEGKENHYIYAGGSNADQVGWYKSNSSGTNPVGQKLPNALGLYDMSGNVWEWCHDWYNNSYYASSPGNNPQGPKSGIYRMYRGGGWPNNVSNLRVAGRQSSRPGYRYNDVGFRPARTP